MNCVYYSLYNPNEQYIKQLKASLYSLKQYNPKLKIIVFSNTSITDVKVSFFNFKSDKHTFVTHKHIHYGKLNDYDTTLFLDCDTLIGGNLDELFNRYNNGVYMRPEKNSFNTGTIFTNSQSRYILNGSLNEYLNMMDNTWYNLWVSEQEVFTQYCLLKGLIINALPKEEVGLGGTECFKGKQLIRHYFSSNTKYFI